MEICSLIRVLSTAGLALLLALFSVPATAQSPAAPVISDLKVQPDRGFAGSSYVIRLKIKDPQGAEDIVDLLYHVRESQEWIKVPINDKGINGDERAGDGVYTGRTFVPRSADMSTHRFEVHVRDRSGNQSNTLTYTFTVLQEFQL